MRAVPASQDVVNAYGNTDEGDQSAGLTRSGPAAADYVGRVEADAMLAAWREAGGHMTTTPELATAGRGSASAARRPRAVRCR